MDTRVPERMAPRSEEGAKGSESSKPYPPNQLVRMRSAVRICLAAPKKPPFSLKRAVFFCILLLFRSVLISGQRFDHTTSHRQRKTGLRRCLPSEACCFSSLHILAAAAALFLLRSPPSFAESGGLTAPRTLLWSLRRHCGHAFFRPARSGSSGLPRDDR